MSEKIARVAYRLDTSPATYDCLSFLAITEVARRASAVDKLVIAIVPGRRHLTERDHLMPSAIHTWRSEVLLPQLAMLLPSCCGVVRGDPATDQQTVPYITAPLPYGPHLVGPTYMQALLPFSEPYLTVTVRQSWLQLERNTAGWWNDLIPRLPLPVVVVPDTEASLAGHPCVVTAGTQYEPAAWNVALRFALYKKARLNLFTSGGPCMLAPYSDLHAEIFGLHVPQHPACTAVNLTKIGMLDGRVVQNTRFHWDQNADQIVNAVKERLT